MLVVCRACARPKPELLHASSLEETLTSESKLRRALGTQVRILEDGTGAGKVEISYFNRQDLDRLYTLIMSACS